MSSARFLVSLGLIYFLEEPFSLVFGASSLVPQQEMRIITVTNLTILQQSLQAANFTFIKALAHGVSC